LEIVGVMGKSVGGWAWSRASPPWESAERPQNECPLLGHFLQPGAAICRQQGHDGRSPLTEDTISLTTSGSAPIAWQAGQAQLPLRRHPEKLVEPAAAALGVGSDDHEIEATQQRTWADRTAVADSTPWDAGREGPANGQLVDAYG
jgi:hypothetical protein